MLESIKLFKKKDEAGEVSSTMTAKLRPLQKVVQHAYFSTFSEDAWREIVDSMIPPDVGAHLKSIVYSELANIVQESLDDTAGPYIDENGFCYSNITFNFVEKIGENMC